MFNGDDTITTANSILEKMEGLNYQTFITDYLMRPPVNQLDAVQGVAFTALTRPA